MERYQYVQQYSIVIDKLLIRIVFQARSSIITAFSICSFGNPGSLAVIIGTLNAMAPDRRVAISKVAVRAFVAGSIVSFITAGIAGMLLTDELILQVSNENNFHNGSVEILF